MTPFNQSGKSKCVVLRGISVLLLMMWLPMTSMAATVSVSIADNNGSPIENAVVSLHPLDRRPPAAVPGSTAIMDQRGLSFVPLVLPVRVGTQVLFPNSDQVRHHVYSFSQVKQFELRLYPNTHTPHVTFTHPGVDVLGCNIHDWMLGYIYILDTPYFAKSGRNGRIRLSDIPAGRYELRLWQPFMEADTAYIDTEITLKKDESFRHQFEIALHAPDETNAPPTELGIQDPGSRVMPNHDH